MVGFSFRFHPAVRRLLELMRAELGRGWLLNAEYVFDWLPPRESWLWDPANGNGIFNENSCHIFDVVCAVMGRPETVSAAGAVFVGRPSEEAGALALTFAGGGIGAITVGGVGASPFRGFPRLDVCTEKGRAELRGSEHTWRSLEWGMRGAKETSAYVAPPESLGATRYTAALEHFFAALRNGAEPEATVDDGVLAVALAEAVYRAARTRETVRVEGTGRP
jgi:predicted dehydrogenase